MKSSKRKIQNPGYKDSNKERGEELPTVKGRKAVGSQNVLQT